MKVLFKLILYGFGVVTIVGMGFLTKAVLNMSTSKMKCYPKPEIANILSTDTETNKINDKITNAANNTINNLIEVTTIDLNEGQTILAKISVVCFWILLFFTIVVKKIFF